jgi:hypothetical protein
VFSVKDERKNIFFKYHKRFALESEGEKEHKWRENHIVNVALN